MKKFLITVVVCFAIALILPIASCEKTGCTNPLAVNYNSKAKKDDGSCKILGCIDPKAANYDSLANVNDGSCVYLGNTGQVVFWQESGVSPALTTVVMDGLQRTITQYYVANSPTCASPGCAIFTLPVGTYSFTATARYRSWTDSVTITYGGCFTYQLY